MRFGLHAGEKPSQCLPDSRPGYLYDFGLGHNDNVVPPWYRPGIALGALGKKTLKRIADNGFSRNAC